MNYEKYLQKYYNERTNKIFKKVLWYIQWKYNNNIFISHIQLHHLFLFWCLLIKCYLIRNLLTLIIESLIQYIQLFFVWIFLTSKNYSNQKYLYFFLSFLLFHVKITFFCGLSVKTLTKKCYFYMEVPGDGLGVSLFLIIEAKISDSLS